MSERGATRAECEPDAAALQQPPGGRGLAASLGPWLIAGALIAYFFTRVPAEAAWSAARSARPEIFVPVMAGAVVVWFWIDSATYAFLFTRFNAPVSSREARSLRGLSYLLTPIHWNVGKAALILRLRRMKGIPLLEGTSTVLLVQAVDGLVLAGLAVAGATLLASRAELPAGVRGTMLVAVVVIASNLVLLRASRPRLRWLLWWRSLALHHAHRRLTTSDFLRIALYKSAYHLVFVLVCHLGARAFDIDLPFALALAAAPIIAAVAALPITPAGLGTQQAAMLYLFGDRFGGGGSEASVLAFGFALALAMIVGRCLIGLCYLGDWSRQRAARTIPDSGMGPQAVSQSVPSRENPCTLSRPRGAAATSLMLDDPPCPHSGARPDGSPTNPMTNTQKTQTKREE